MINTKLRPMGHQLSAASDIVTHRQRIIKAGCGTGKTIATLLSILNLLKDKKIGERDSVLIIGPKSALAAWDRDIDKFDPADQIRLRGAIFTVINYDRIFRPSAEWIMKRDYDVIVADEIHLCKSNKSKRTKALLNLALRQEEAFESGMIKGNYRIGLTGTPISNEHLFEVWSYFAFVSPKRGPRSTESKEFGSFYAFANSFFNINRWHQPERPINEKAESMILGRFKAIATRIKKEDCLDLPPQTDIKVMIPATPEQKALHKEVTGSSCISNLEVTFDNALARLTAARCVAAGFITDDGGNRLPVPNQKLDTLIELLEEIGKNEKVVIFTAFKLSASLIAQRLKKEGITFSTLTGDSKDKSIWRKWQEDNTRVIIVNYQTGNAGIDLYAAHYTIYYDQQLSSIVYEQSKDRTHRKGQTGKCFYYHFLTKGTVEESIYNSLKSHMDYNKKKFDVEWRTDDARKGASSI